MFGCQSEMETLGCRLTYISGRRRVDFFWTLRVEFQAMRPRATSSLRSRYDEDLAGNSMDQRPASLDYRPPGNGRSRAKTQFLWGLVGGSIFSAAFWLFWWHMNSLPQTDSNALTVVPAVKFGIAVVCFFNPKWTSFGAGILVSIAVGFMIFCGLCFANFKI
jgi:hypothetical protein